VTRCEAAEIAAGTCAWSRRRARSTTGPRPPARGAGALPTGDAPPGEDALRGLSPPPAGDVRPPAPGGADSSSRAVTTVFADPLRIAQACANLVGNAAEHGGGVVRVRVRATGDRVRIEVADDGPGLPMSVSALTAAAAARRGRRGHGLAIAAAIAEHHGGRLHAAPSDGGARLMLDMPAAHEPVVA
jgi:signal transduction histidine kinase